MLSRSDFFHLAQDPLGHVHLLFQLVGLCGTKLGQKYPQTILPVFKFCLLLNRPHLCRDGLIAPLDTKPLLFLSLKLFPPFLYPSSCVMLGASGCLPSKWMEPDGNQGLLRREEKSVVPTSPQPTDHPALPSFSHKLRGARSPGASAIGRGPSCVDTLGGSFSRSTHQSLLFGAWLPSGSDLCSHFPPFLPLHPPLHTSLILAKPRGEGGGGGFWRGGGRERQALQHPGAAIEWLSDGAYLSPPFFFSSVGNFQDFIAAI